MKDFSSTHASKDTSKEIILDYARKNLEFSTSEIYDVMSGKSKVWIRQLLVKMIKSNEIKRVSQGIYTLVTKEQSKKR
jgi:hypothetical protein